MDYPYPKKNGNGNGGELRLRLRDAKGARNRCATERGVHNGCARHIFICVTKINEKLNHFLPQDSSANGRFGGEVNGGKEHNRRR